MFQSQQYAALVQVQPFEVDLGTEFDPSTAPVDWILDAPDADHDQWRHQVVSQPQAAGHDVWLVGLTLACSAALWSGPRRWQLLAGGVGIAVVGVAAQALVGIG
jgi:hypothetical protein